MAAAAPSGYGKPGYTNLCGENMIATCGMAVLRPTAGALVEVVSRAAVSGALPEVLLSLLHSLLQVVRAASKVQDGSDVATQLRAFGTQVLLHCVTVCPADVVAVASLKELRRLTFGPM